MKSEKRFRRRMLSLVELILVGLVGYAAVEPEQFQEISSRFLSQVQTPQLTQEQRETLRFYKEQEKVLQRLLTSRYNQTQP